MQPYAGFNQPFQTPSSPIIFEPSKEVVSPLVSGSINLAKEGAEILHPKYSFVYHGFRLMCEPEGGGDYLRGFNNAMGFLFLAASPIIETGRVVLGIGATVIGAVGTVALAPAMGSEKLARKILNLNKLDDPALKRQVLMNAFIKRIDHMIQNAKGTVEQKQELRDNPIILIAISALSLANHSKKEFGKCLRMGDNAILDESQIEPLDDMFKGYFYKTCELKTQLSHHPIRDYSWNVLMEKLDDCTQTIDAAAPEVPVKLSYRERLKMQENEKIKEIHQKAMGLAISIFEDPAFQEAWLVKTMQNNNNNNNNNG